MQNDQSLLVIVRHVLFTIYLNIFYCSMFNLSVSNCSCTCTCTLPVPVPNCSCTCTCALPVPVPYLYLYLTVAVPVPVPYLYLYLCLCLCLYLYLYRCPYLCLGISPPTTRCTTIFFRWGHYLCFSMYCKPKYFSASQ